MKVMTYNVHSCVDMLGRNSIQRISELIKREEISIAGLNEIETRSPRTRFTNQPQILAETRDMVHQFGPTIKLGPFGFFGNAVLSRYPIYDYQNIRLPGSVGWEFRYCLSARLQIPGGFITVMSTHLGLNGDDRKQQINELQKLIKQSRDPVILMGDFNCREEELRPLRGMLTDTGEVFGAEKTFPSDQPSHRIDYILISPDIRCSGVYVPENDASDHLPVIAELEF